MNQPYRTPSTALAGAPAKPDLLLAALLPVLLVGCAVAAVHLARSDRIDDAMIVALVVVVLTTPLLVASALEVLRCASLVRRVMFPNRRRSR